MQPFQRPSAKRKRIQTSPALASIIARAVSIDLQAGQVEALKKLLTTIRVHLTQDVPAQVKALLLLSGAQCAHVVGLMEDADRYLRQLFALPTHIPADELALAQRLHVRTYLDRRDYDLASEMLDEIDRDVLVLAGEQVEFDRGGHTFTRRQDPRCRIAGDPARISAATHLLKAEYCLATGDFHQATIETKQASLKLSSASPEDGESLSIMQALIGAIEAESPDAPALTQLARGWESDETIAAAPRGRLSALLSWDGTPPHPDGINIHEARRWSSFRSLLTSHSPRFEPAPPVQPENNEDQVDHRVIAFPVLVLTPPPAQVVSFPAPVRTQEEIPWEEPFAHLLEEIDGADSRRSVNHDATITDSDPTLDSLLSNPFPLAAASQVDYDLTVRDLSAFTLDSILGSIEQSRLTGHLDLFWDSATIETAVEQAILDSPLECSGGAVYFRDGLIVDAVLHSADGGEPALSPNDALAVLVRLALSVATGVRAQLKRAAHLDRPATVSISNNAGAILQIIGIQDESAVDLDSISRFSACAATQSPDSSDAALRDQPQTTDEVTGIEPSSLVSIYEARSPDELALRLKEATSSVRVEILYNGSVVAHRGPTTDIQPHDLIERSFVFRLFTKRQPDSTINALLLAAASRFLSMPPDAAAQVSDVDGEIITTSKEMRHVTWQTRRVATADGIQGPLAHVLILGETGVGKELIAKLVHSCSRRTGELVTENMARLRKDLCSVALFGAAKGAYTGATRDRVGLIESAEGGSLFLDEVGVMDGDDQAQLLRVLQTGAYTRVGDARERQANVRFILATNRDPRTELLQDLRGRCFEIHIPPLRARKSDIRPLALAFARTYNANLSEAALVWLEQQEWRRNVRQLQNLIHQSSLYQEDRSITPELLEELYREPEASDIQLPQSSTDAFQPLLPDETFSQASLRFNRAVIQKALAEHDHNITHAARRLDITAHGLRDKAKRCGLDIRRTADQDDVSV